uniref:Putative secreted peptide n=1 Tax=Rhipicephalus pulchellus TaxID=72859 RepID=L7M9K7_RHIPC
MASSSCVASLILLLAYGFTFSAALYHGKRYDNFCQEPKPRDNCTCYIRGKKLIHRDNTACYVLSSGYNDELDYKAGACKNGECKYTNISYGCKHVTEEQKKRMTLGGQVGCAFTCYSRETNKKEFAYYYNDAPCLHAVGPGKYTNGTCVSENDKMICRELPTPLSC